MAKKKDGEFPGSVLFTEGESHARGTEDKPSDKELDSMLNDLYPEKGEKKEPYKGYDLSGNKASEDPDRYARTRPAGSDRAFSGLGDEYKEPKSQPGQYSNTPYEGIPIANETMGQAQEREEARAKREKEWAIEKKLPWESPNEADKRRQKEGLSKVAKYEGESVINATYRNIKGTSLNPVDMFTGAKGYASESKLKWEASKYGITPEDFEKYKAGKMLRGYSRKGEPIYGGSLAEVKAIIDQGRSRAAGLKHAETLDKKTKAETEALLAQATQRYAKAEVTNPKSVNKMVQFGANDFGQTPIYITGGSHGAVRQKFLPGQNTGVSTSLAASRLEIARMKERVLSGGGTNAVQLLQPRSNIVGLPTAVSRLAGGKHVNSVSKLSPTGQYRMGPSILDKLSSFRKRP